MNTKCYCYGCRQEKDYEDIRGQLILYPKTKDPTRVYSEIKKVWVCYTCLDLIKIKFKNNRKGE